MSFKKDSVVDSLRTIRVHPFSLQEGEKGKAGMVFVCTKSCLFLDRVWKLAEKFRAPTAAIAETVPRHFALSGSEKAKEAVEAVKESFKIQQSVEAPKPLSEVEEVDVMA